MISCARKTMSTVCSKRPTSKLPSSRRNFMRLIEARLQAESSTCMYSEHGFDALMRPEFGDVCHWLIVVSYCTPGSAQRHAASAISRISSRAGTVSVGSPVVRESNCQYSSFSTACMNSSVTRTELFAFWYWIDWKPSPSIDMSKPASRSAAALPPFVSGSIDPRMFDRLMPDPEPPRKIVPSLVFQSRIDSIVSSTERMKHAEHCGFSSNPTLNQTGELNAASWWSRMYVSSDSNVSPSSTDAK